MDKNREIEVRFLEIDKDALIKKLKQLNAVDNGAELIKEIIFYDKDMKWLAEWKFVRLRQDKNGFWLTFKKTEEFTLASTIEIETKVDNWDKAKEFIEAIGLVAFREQEKKGIGLF